MESVEADTWVTVKKGKHSNPLQLLPKSEDYTRLSNAYSSLLAFTADPPDPDTTPTSMPMSPPLPQPRKFNRKALLWFLARQKKRDDLAAEEQFFFDSITNAEDE